METVNGVHKIVFVIGNGFDLDLGLKTSYKDYMNSACFNECADNYPQIAKGLDGVNLFDYLRKKLQVPGKENWFDLEQELADFAQLQTKQKLVSGELDKKSFSDLKDNLCTYLKNIDYEIDSKSMALRLFSILMDDPVVNIISFNYTDLKRLVPSDKTIHASIDYIHGSILDDSLILGFNDELDIEPSYSFMRKTFSRHYKSHNVTEKLLDADEIIFFGHSFGTIDYQYFKDLFIRQSQLENANKKMIIRIFTKDDKSRIDILSRLNHYNNKRTYQICDYCDFRVYKTDEGMEDIDMYFDELGRRSLNNICECIIQGVSRIQIRP